MLRIDKELSYDSFKKEMEDNFKHILIKGHSQIYEDRKARQELYESKKREQKEKYKNKSNQETKKRFSIINDSKEDTVKGNKEPRIRNFSKSDNKENKDSNKATIKKRFKFEE